MELTASDFVSPTLEQGLELNIPRWYYGLEWFNRFGMPGWNLYVPGSGIFHPLYNPSATTSPPGVKIEKTGYNGIVINSREILSTGAGDDTVKGIGLGANGIYNDGLIDTGAGNDTITGSGPAYGIYVYFDGEIRSGDGNDSIKGSSQQGKGIVNFGLISTGVGNDIVDAQTGGFSGSGLTDLGDGNDTLIGFGSGRFRGGSGIDTLVLQDGTYTTTSNRDGSYVINGVMNVSGFEAIQSPGGPQINFSSLLIPGSFTIGTTVSDWSTPITRIPSTPYDCWPCR